MEPEQPSKSSSVLGEVVKHGPSWFAALAGLTYASGFLIDFTFLQVFGVREAAGDFLKAKSIHVGVLFMLFPISVLVPLAVALNLNQFQNPADSRSKNTASLKIPRTSFLLYLNMGWIFYLYVLFAPRRFLGHADKEGVLPFIFLASVFGPWIIEKVDRSSHRLATNLRLFLFVCIVAPLDFIALRGLFPDLWHVFWGRPDWLPSGGVYYLVFMLLIPYTLYRANQRATLMSTSRAQLVFRLSGICLCFIFYFLAIVVFAVRVYPFIPVSKGGGDYTESPYVIWSGATNGPTASFTILTNGRPITSNYFVVIDQTSDALILANTNEAGGPAVWREMRRLPNIIEVKRESVLPMTYHQMENFGTNSP